MDEFSKRLVPDMLTLLRKNLIANPEKLLLELVDEQLAYLDKLAKEQSSKNSQTTKKLNKVSEIILEGAKANCSYLMALKLNFCPLNESWEVSHLINL